jgi:hypothetical protein
MEGSLSTCLFLCFDVAACGFGNVLNSKEYQRSRPDQDKEVGQEQAGPKEVDKEEAVFTKSKLPLLLDWNRLSSRSHLGQ